jgi:serine/threonine protein kinase
VPSAANRPAQITRPAETDLARSDLDGPRPPGSIETAWSDETGLAPSFRSLARTSPSWDDPAPDERFVIGQLVDDFEILGLLGEGSLARVYLARQVSLGRHVALKVSAARSAEARALAMLEHEHIVRIFSVGTDRARGLRLLCMQYVPGVSLEGLIRRLRSDERRSRCGRTILEAVDALGPHPGAITPAALRDRESLERSDWVEAVCWVGARLAEALAHAHARGVLHRDIKPANILVDPYGRPLLADFNLASDPGRDDEAGIFGGSLAYMAPEHLEAFNPQDPTTTEAVDERSDLFSLGVVVFELLTGTRPFGSAEGPSRATETLRAMAAERRAGPPSARTDLPDLLPALDRALRRCLDPDPAQRHPTAVELARDLEGCRELRRIQGEQPTGPLCRAALRRPAVMLVLATFLPHLLGSSINISYNALQIVGLLAVEQQVLFGNLVLAYNALVYPLCMGLAYRLAAPVFRAWQAVDRSRPIGEEVVAVARRRALGWPMWAVALACAGWLPGGILFPWILDTCSGGSSPIGPEVYLHFLASFWLSGLIALTYSFFGVEAIALRVMYPRLWVDARGLRATMRAELGRREPRLAAFQLLASLIPLSGAALLIGLGPEDMTRTFRTLVGALIVIGMAGAGLTHSAGRLLSRVIAIMAGSDVPPDPRRPGATRPPSSGG